MKPIISFAFAIVYCFLQTVVVLAQEEEPKPQYRFVVSWDPWDEDDGRLWQKLDFRLNGKSIGTPWIAFLKLDELPVKKGEHVKLDMPKRVAKQWEFTTAFFPAGFIHHWMEKGAFADLYEDGKMLNVHTITWKDWFIKGNYIRNMDDVTWIADGEVIGKGSEFLKLIEKWEKEPDLVIQVLKPFGYDPDPPADGVAYGRLRDLWAEKKIRMLHVRPPEKDVEPVKK